jgi:hypothetical protein
MPVRHQARVPYARTCVQPVESLASTCQCKTLRRTARQSKAAQRGPSTATCPARVTVDPTARSLSSYSVNRSPRAASAFERQAFHSRRTAPATLKNPASARKIQSLPSSLASSGSPFATDASFRQVRAATRHCRDRRRGGSSRLAAGLPLLVSYRAFFLSFPPF